MLDPATYTPNAPHTPEKFGPLLLPLGGHMGVTRECDSGTSVLAANHMDLEPAPLSSVQNRKQVLRPAAESAGVSVL
jgi:hypothetical protein